MSLKKKLMAVATTQIKHKTLFNTFHYVKSDQIRSFFWSVFSRIWTRINTVFGHFFTLFWKRRLKNADIQSKISL